MTVHNQCSAAARQLLAQPDLRPATEGPKGLFTELDVIFLAAHEAQVQDSSPEQQEAWMREAQHEASQVMGALYRTSKVARFGPVTGFPRLTKPDYVRHVGKILYAPPKGPAAVKTPNGTFERMMVSGDRDPKPGRRAGADRDDLLLWETQVVSRAEKPPTPEGREILRLRAENAALRAQVEQQNQEISRLRAQLADTVTKADIHEMMDRFKKVA